MPKVSVVIPVYGVEKYIERCARSLFEQTLDDIEFIFVDDCTPDRSMEILAQIIKEYRLRFAEMNYVVRTERMPANSGLAAVRRHGIQLCTGDYIIHCDSDDWVDRDLYRQMYSKALESNADIIISNYCKSDGVERHPLKGVSTSCVKSVYFSNLMKVRETWALWNKLVKKSLYNNPIKYPVGAMAEDMTLFIQLLYFAKDIKYVDTKTYYFYYENSESITMANSKEKILHRFKQSIDNASVLLSFCMKYKIYELYKYDIDYLLFNKKNLIAPLIKEKVYYKQWYDTFPELNYRIFLNPCVPLRNKILHVKNLTKGLF